MTQTTKHTPGPWELPVGVDPIEDVWDSTGQFKIASFVRGREHGGDEGTANARLIAAAPELLAALKTVALRFNDDDPDAMQARAAIAKAEGR